MRNRKKIILSLCLFVLLFPAALCGTVIYYYYHPSATKDIVERTVSRATGVSLTIKTLSYSLKPFCIRAKGITLEPGETLPGFHLEINDFKVDFALEGPFGERDLLIKHLWVDGFSLRFSEKLNLPRLSQKEESRSLFAMAVTKIKALLLFKKIKLGAGECMNGDIASSLEGHVIGINNIRAMFKADGLWEISCSVNVKRTLKGMHFSTPDLHLSATPGLSRPGQTSVCLLTAKRAAFKTEGAEIRHMDINARVVWDPEHNNFAFEPLNILMGEVRLETGSEVKSFLQNLLLRIRGRFKIRERKVMASDIHLFLSRLPGDASHGRDYPPARRQANIVEFKGRLRTLFGTSNIVDLRVEECRIFPQGLKTFLPQKMKESLNSIVLSGPVLLSGLIKGRKWLQTWRWQGDLETLFDKNRFSYRTGQNKLDSLISGSVSVKGEFPDMKISMVLQGDKTIIKGKAEALKPWQASLSLEGKNSFFLLKKLAFYLPQVKIGKGDKDLIIEDMRLHAEKGRLDRERRSLFLPEIRLSTSLLTNILLNLGVDGKGITLKAEGEEAKLLRTVQNLGLIPSGWQLEGSDSFQIEAMQKENGIWSLKSSVSFRDLGFENKKGTVMGEKISLKAGVEGEIDLEKASVSAHASLEMEGGELLYDRFYFDLNRNRFFSDYKGRYDISKGSLSLTSLDFGFRNIVVLKLKGTFNHKGQGHPGHLFLRIPEIPLAPLFRHFIQEPYQTEKAFLNDMKIAGNISADLEWKGNRTDWLTRGRFMWKNGQLSLGEKGLLFKGIDLELPVWHQTVGEEVKADGQKGALSIRSMVLPHLPEQPLNIEFNASPNLLAVKSPTLLRIPGGEVRIGPIMGRNILGPRPTIETNLTMNKVDVKPLLSRVWPQPISGTIEGKLDPLLFEGDILSSKGEIKIRIFDGEIIFSNLGASGMFTPFPVLRLNALLKNLSLEEPTSGTPFGKIEGLLKGYINNLEIAYGQPQRFNLLLETVRHKGVSQRISVKAVENIAQIGGGQSPFLGLAGGFAYFFKEFPYRKIGVRASLENDVFRINGTVMEGGKEYLVKRGRFSGVDIVNQNPDNRISFKDMVRRIKRVTAGKGGPVIR